MLTAKLFKNGRSQAVRLPKKFRFKGNQVYIRQFGEGVLLLPEDNDWDTWYSNLEKYSENIIPEREQPSHSEERELF